MKGMAEDDAIQMYRDGHCCACGGAMEGSVYINQVSICRRPTWKYPISNNLLVESWPDQACAIVCDTCIERAEDEPLDIRFAIENRDGELVYHDVNLLDDITAEVEAAEALHPDNL